MNPFESSQLQEILQKLSETLTTHPTQAIVFFAFLAILLVIFAISYRKIQQLNDLLVESEDELELAKETHEQLKDVITNHKIREARLITLLKTERRNSSEKLALLEDARDQLKLQFSSLAQEIFDDKSQTFTNQSKERLDALLQPFHLQLHSLKQEIRQTYLNDTRERASLKQELMQLQDLNRQMGEEAINLTRALKGDKKLQGNWGELVLERVLEQSGLRRGHEYQTQQGYRDENNRLFKPDVIIHLPEGKDVIIDSKVSLSAWERYCSTENSEKQRKAMTDLVLAIRNHIQSLGCKKYEELKGIRSLDLVLMFMPIEAAFMAAFSHDEKLFSDALNQKIVVVTPTTLIATLRTIENIWRYEHQSRNSLEIAQKAGTLYDKFRGFVEDMEKIGKQIDTCHQTYDSAMNKLTQGRGNLIAQAQYLTQLGVQVKKELPKAVTEMADEELRN